jgi:ArsR family transcriptional regulator
VATGSTPARDRPARDRPAGDRPAGDLPVGEAGGGSPCVPSLVAAPLSEPDAVALARVLAALADPVRLRLISIVSSAGEVCSCDLEGPLARSQPTVSHHTTVLAEAGIIVGEKRGRWTWWRLAPGCLAEVRRALGG